MLNSLESREFSKPYQKPAWKVYLEYMTIFSIVIGGISTVNTVPVFLLTSRQDKIAEALVAAGLVSLLSFAVGAGGGAIVANDDITQANRRVYIKS